MNYTADDFNLQYSLRMPRTANQQTLGVETYVRRRVVMALQILLILDILFSLVTCGHSVYECSDQAVVICVITFLTTVYVIIIICGIYAIWQTKISLLHAFTIIFTILVVLGVLEIGFSLVHRELYDWHGYVGKDMICLFNSRPHWSVLVIFRTYGSITALLCCYLQAKFDQDAKFEIPISRRCRLVYKKNLKMNSTALNDVGSTI